MYLKTLFFFALAFSLSAAADDHGEQAILSREERQCARTIRRHLRRTITPGRNLLILPPHSQRLLIGALVKTEFKQQILAVGGYRFQHMYLEEALEVAKDSDGIGEYTYEWLGELVVRNDSPDTALGVVTAANETASKWINDISKRKGKHRNRVKALEDALKNHFPELLADKRTFLTFSQSKWARAEHFCDRLTTFLREFGEAQSLNLIDPKEGYRHFIINRGPTLFLNLEQIADQILRGEPYQTEPISAALKQGLNYEATMLYLEWLRNDGIEPEKVDRIRQWLQRLQFTGLTDEEWSLFASESHLSRGEWSDYEQVTNIISEVHLMSLEPLTSR